MREYEIAVWIQDRPCRNLTLEWHDKDGKRCQKSTKTRDFEEADRKRKDLEYELNHDLYRHPSILSWEDFLTQYRREHLEGLRARTREKAETVFDALAEECSPSKLADIDERLLSDFAAKLRTRPTARNPEGCAPWTIRNYLAVLRAAMNWAREQKIIRACPTFPRIKVPRLRPRAVPSEAFERLFDSLKDPQEKAMVGLGWWAGLRISEAYELRRIATDNFPWVDWASNRLILPAGFVKADEDQWVPLHARVRKLLEAVPAIHESDRYFLFCSSRSGKPFSRASVSGRFSMRAKQAGVRLSHHSLRRGFISRLARDNSAAVTKQIARHSSMDLTMAFYANVDDSLGLAVERLD